jgi:hypothetical protein
MPRLYLAIIIAARASVEPQGSVVALGIKSKSTRDKNTTQKQENKNKRTKTKEQGWPAPSLLTYSAYMKKGRRIDRRPLCR